MSEPVVEFPNNNKEVKCFLCGDTTDYKITRACVKCKQSFCLEHSSKIDPTYCEHCFIDGVLTEDTFQRVTEDYDEETDTVVTIKSPIARRIKLAGADWAYHTERICKQSDEELKLTLQFYKASVSLMEMELVSRKVKQTVQAITSEGGKIGSRKVTDTTVKKVTKVKKPVDLEALLNKMKAMGLTQEQIKSMLG